jgi:signal transduction histidine kinase
MISNEKYGIYLKLQQVILETEDNSDLISIILPQILTELSASKLSYDFISAFFLSSELKLQESYFADKNIQSTQKDVAVSVVNLDFILKKENGFEQIFLKNQVALSSQINNLIHSDFYPDNNLKTVVVAPILKSTQVSGLLVFGSSRQNKEISEDELEFARMLGNLIGVTFKLQDTQKSLVDITQQVYKMNAKLHDLDKLKDDFVSVASHELRTPMTAIRSYAWMALYRSDVPLSEKLKKYLERTLISTERLINLVNDMLNISRIESGRVNITPTSFDIKNLVNDVISEVSPKAKEKNISLQLIDTSLPQTFADPDKVHQVLLNLVGNALKFTPQNGQISISFFSDGQNIDVTVKDSGVGISKDDMSRLFTKFGRLDNSYVAAAASGGTGLGLFICKSLIEMMKGKIWAASEGFSKGTAFTFSLPVATSSVLSNAQAFTQNVTGEAKMLEPTAI